MNMNLLKMKNNFPLVFLVFVTTIFASTISPLYAKTPKTPKTPTSSESIFPTSNQISSQKWWCRAPVIEYRIPADNSYRSREVVGERILGKGSTEGSARQSLKEQCDSFHTFDSSMRVGRKCGYIVRCGTN